jgi:corrinoid protein of di/trimethylamine methyltransferase
LQTASDLQNALTSAMADLHVEVVKELVEKALEQGEDAQRIVETIGRGMEVVGERYEKCEYFLTELFVAGSIMQDMLSILEPRLKMEARTGSGKVVIGTVEGDVHNLGKDIVAIMLKSAGYQIIDLGVDVPAERFVEAIVKEKPVIVAMSALLTTTMQEMRNVIEMSKKENLRNQVKFIIGGRPVTQRFADEIGSDAYGKDATEAVKKAKSLTAG